MDVIIPPKEVQLYIAQCIGAIDKKVELNNSICSDLEDIAKLLYDYWFVQFDFPDENGKPYKSSGGKMVWDAFKGEEADGINPRSFKVQIALAVATSIDALAVGITFACTGYESLRQLGWPLAIIGLASFLMSLLGFGLGVRFGEAVNRKMKPELLGGLILIGIGIKILVEHLTGA
jgi:hypothetical protein